MCLSILKQYITNVLKIRYRDTQRIPLILRDNFCNAVTSPPRLPSYRG
jgi:hypothetical protein